MKLSILGVLNILKSDSLSREELNFLIEKSYSISSSFLKSKFNSKLKFPGRNQDDLAMDAIVPLFIRNSSGEMGIYSSLCKWNDELINEGDADYFLSRIIWRRVEQTVVKELKNNDPIFEKILKTLNTCIKRSKFRKKRYFGTVLVLENDDSKIFGNIIDDRNFNLMPKEIFGLKQLALFNRVFEFLLTETNYYPAIPLNLLVKRVKDYYSSSYLIQSTYNDNSDVRISLDEIVKDAMADIREKIDMYYVQRNKLEQTDAEFIYSAFNNISKDILNGGLHHSLYIYLKDYHEKMSRDLFYSKYHHIMNYLLQRLKSNILENLYY